MNKLKKSFFIISMILLIISLSACNNTVTPPSVNNGNGNNKNETNDIQIEFLSHDEAIKKFGKVSKIFNPSASNSRFYNGQRIHIRRMLNIAEFKANLIEYDSLDPKIARYVENIPEANALMHQGYADTNYIKDKIYVELASYTDIENGKVIQFEVRIFRGDFWEKYTNKGWYARSVTFSPDFKIDISNNINIETGEKVYYEYPYAKYPNMEAFDPSKYITQEVKQNPDTYISKLGSINKIYKHVLKENEKDNFSKITNEYSNTENLYIQSFFVEFNSLTPIFEQYVDSINNETCFFETYDIPFESGKIYGEYLIYTGLDSKKDQFHELKIVTQDKSIKNISFRNEELGVMIDAIDNNKTLDEAFPMLVSLTEIMKKQGTFSKYYDKHSTYFFNNTGSSYLSSRMFEYDSVNPIYDSVYDSLVQKYGECGFMTSDPFDANKRYLDLIIWTNKETNKVDVYKIRIQGKNQKRPVQCEMSPEQFFELTSGNYTSIN